MNTILQIVLIWQLINIGVVVVLVLPEQRKSNNATAALSGGGSALHRDNGSPVLGVGKEGDHAGAAGEHPQVGFESDRRTPRQEIKS